MTRRRKVNYEQAREDKLKRGVCPKCNLHVGRGVRRHHDGCKGMQ